MKVTFPNKNPWLDDGTDPYRKYGVDYKIFAVMQSGFYDWWKQIDEVYSVFKSVFGN